MYEIFWIQKGENSIMIWKLIIRKKAIRIPSQNPSSEYQLIKIIRELQKLLNIQDGDISIKK